MITSDTPKQVSLEKGTVVVKLDGLRYELLTDTPVVAVPTGDTSRQTSPRLVGAGGCPNPFNSQPLQP